MRRSSNLLALCAVVAVLPAVAAAQDAPAESPPQTAAARVDVEREVGTSSAELRTFLSNARARMDGLLSDLAQIEKGEGGAACTEAARVLVDLMAGAVVRASADAEAALQDGDVAEAQKAARRAALSLDQAKNKVTEASLCANGGEEGPDDLRIDVEGLDGDADEDLQPLDLDDDLTTGVSKESPF